MEPRKICLLYTSTIICGDGTDQELLDSENLSSCDAFVALTDRDEDNLIISLYAAQLGLSKVITKSNRQNYNRIAQAVGLDSIISPKQLATSHILQVVRGMQNSQGSVMNALYLSLIHIYLCGGRPGDGPAHLLPR